MKNILFSVENTDPKCYWLVGYLETLLVQVRETQRFACPGNQTVTKLKLKIGIFKIQANLN